VYSGSPNSRQQFTRYGATRAIAVSAAIMTPRNRWLQDPAVDKSKKKKPGARNDTEKMRVRHASAADAPSATALPIDGFRR